MYTVNITHIHIQTMQNPAFLLHFRSGKWLTVDWIAFEKWSGANQPNFSTHYVVSLKRKKEDQTNN